MQKRVPKEVQRLATLPTVALGESAEGFETVKGFLARFGYFKTREPSTQEGARATASQLAPTLDESTSIALVKYQAMHGLPLTGVFDHATREMMSRARCGFPDVDPATAVSFSITCTWSADTLTYAFDTGTGDIGGDDEREAVRRAFNTWCASVQIAFREVGINDSPDIRIAWTQANCGDANMTGGVLAHADYPPGCGFYGNALPRPLHFDDQENTWCIGAVDSQFDVETVALHEIGHLLGLAHSDVAGAVMFPTVSANATNRVLAPDDLEGIRRLYPIRGPVFSRHSGRCLDIEGISTDNGADATQWDYWGGWNQLFRIEWVEAGHYRLIAQHSGRVLDVDGISTANGAQIHQWDWWGGDNQKFRLDPVGHGYYRVVAKHSGRCLDVTGSPWTTARRSSSGTGGGAATSNGDSVRPPSFPDIRARAWTSMASPPPTAPDSFNGSTGEELTSDFASIPWAMATTESWSSTRANAWMSRESRWTTAHRSSSGSTGVETTRGSSPSRQAMGTIGSLRSTVASASMSAAFLVTTVRQSSNGIGGEEAISSGGLETSFGRRGEKRDPVRIASPA